MNLVYVIVSNYSTKLGIGRGEVATLIASEFG